jgi:hypothetical protein
MIWEDLSSAMTSSPVVSPISETASAVMSDVNSYSLACEDGYLSYHAIDLDLQDAPK